MDFKIKSKRDGCISLKDNQGNVIKMLVGKDSEFNITARQQLALSNCLKTLKSNGSIFVEKIEKGLKEIKPVESEVEAKKDNKKEVKKDSKKDFKTEKKKPGRKPKNE